MQIFAVLGAPAGIVSPPSHAIYVAAHPRQIVRRAMPDSPWSSMTPTLAKAAVTNICLRNSTCAIGHQTYRTGSPTSWSSRRGTPPDTPPSPWPTRASTSACSMRRCFVRDLTKPAKPLKMAA
jgi:hypothetical protein